MKIRETPSESAQIELSEATSSLILQLKLTLGSVLYIYGLFGKSRLAHTAIINSMFLI